MGFTVRKGVNVEVFGAWGGFDYGVDDFGKKEGRKRGIFDELVFSF